MNKAAGGDESAAASLFAMLYDELRNIARKELVRYRIPGGFGVTTLLHEAYLAVCERSKSAAFPDRARFMAYASRVMRGLIIDDYRRRYANKRGGSIQHTSYLTDQTPSVEEPRWLERLSDALDELAAHHPTLAETVDLRFFCGFTFAEIASMRGVSERTVKRHWERSRLYLHRALGALGPMA
jgi:RNA polymerase sigma factor (TIGR02999 family)